MKAKLSILLAVLIGAALIGCGSAPVIAMSIRFSVFPISLSLLHPITDVFYQSKASDDSKDHDQDHPTAADAVIL